MKEKMKNQCTLERQGEKFIVEVPEEGKGATVTDRLGVVITIKYGSGHFDTRLPNGWGAGKTQCLKLLTTLFLFSANIEGDQKRKKRINRCRTTLRTASRLVFAGRVGSRPLPTFLAVAGSLSPQSL